MSLAAAIKSASWARGLFEDIFAVSAGEIPIAEDNNGAEINARGPVKWSTSRHFAIDVQYVREEVKNGMVTIWHCNTNDMIADFFTKPLAEDLFLTHLRKMMIVVESSPKLESA